MPRIIQLPMSGRDRRHYVNELKKAQAAHPGILERAMDAYRVAHALACEEWNVRQFIGGPAEPSPTIGAAIDGGRELLEVRCRRCGHESDVDLTLLIWPRGNHVHTLAKVLRCQQCSDERKNPVPDLVALKARPGPMPAAPGMRQRTR